MTDKANLSKLARNARVALDALFDALTPMLDEQDLERNARDDDSVYRAVCALPNRPWREVRPLARIGVQRADMARSRLIASGRVTATEVPYTDSKGRLQKRRLLAPTEREKAPEGALLVTGRILDRLR